MSNGVAYLSYLCNGCAVKILVKLAILRKTLHTTDAEDGFLRILRIRPSNVWYEPNIEKIP